MEAERSTRPGYELIVASGRGVAIRAPLVKQITSVGSAPAADLGVAALPPHWAIVHRRGDAVEVHHLASGQRVTLGAGQVIQLDGYTVGLVAAGETLALDQLAERLAAADGPGEALTTIVDGVIAVAGADLGAVILAERGGFTVAVARDADGRTLDDADQLLSDTIVDEVLGSGAAVRADDVAATPYREVRSVVRLGLRAVVCLSAYRKLTGLYNMTVLAISVNQPTQGVLGRLDVQGIAFDNGMKLASHYLKAFRWEAAP